MRSIIKTVAVVTGLAAVAGMAAPAQAAALDSRYNNSGVSFSITLGSGAQNRYAPRREYWNRYPSYGHGYKSFPGYDYVRRNYAYQGNTCYWRVNQGHYNRRSALVKSLVCYDRYGNGYEVAGSQQVVRYYGQANYRGRHYDRGRNYDRGHRSYRAGYHGRRH